jgi:hypothetical protein
VCTKFDRGSETDDTLSVLSMSEVKTELVPVCVSRTTAPKPRLQGPRPSISMSVCVCMSRSNCPKPRLQGPRPSTGMCVCACVCVFIRDKKFIVPT